MTGSAAVNKCFFHSPLGPVAATTSTTEVVTCQPTSDFGYTRERCPQILCPAINAEIFSGAAAKSRPVNCKKPVFCGIHCGWWTLGAADRVAALQHLTFDTFQNAHQSPVTDYWAKPEKITNKTPEW